MPRTQHRQVETPASWTIALQPQFFLLKLSPWWYGSVVAAFIGMSALCPSVTLAKPRTRRVGVRVVEVAGEHAYLSTGEKRGLRPGTLVRLGGKRYRVQATSENNASIKQRKRRLAPGQRGRATVVRSKRKRYNKLSKPALLSSFRGQWVKATKPAETQSPKFVAIGETGRSSKNRLIVTAGISAVGSFRNEPDPFVRAQLRGQLHAQPFDEVPFRIDADATIQGWLGQSLMSGRSRPALRVRQMQMAYGNSDEFNVDLGRMRAASVPVGMVDGARIQSPTFHGVTLAAFGGTLPDPDQGTPDIKAQRFGAEVVYRNLQTSLAPEVGIVGHGSMFSGQLDERRINAYAQLFPGQSRLGVHGEVAFYDRDNPWNRSEVELSMFGVDGSTRIGVWHANARFDMRRPERSYWLDSFFPSSWLCSNAPVAATSLAASESCASADSTRYTGTVSTGVQFQTWSLTTGGHVIATEGTSEISSAGGYLAARVVRLFDFAHVDVNAAGSTGAIIQSYTIQIGGGVSLNDGRTLIDLYYRPGVSKYRADTGFWLVQNIGAQGSLMLGEQWDLLVGLDTVISQDVDAWIAQSQMRWRPIL